MVDENDNAASPQTAFTGNLTVDAEKGLPPHVTVVIVNLNIGDVYNNMPTVPENTSVPRWFPIVGALFAAISMIFLMYLVVGPPIESSKRIIFNVFIAFSISASLAFLGGQAVANGSIPIFKESPVRFAATGGIAAFLVVLAFMSYLN